MGNRVMDGVARPLAGGLPVLPALEPLLAVLPRGTVVGVSGRGATSLALALVAGPSSAGRWVSVVGVPKLSPLAAAELGVVLERLALVATPSVEAWPKVVAALLVDCDVVVAGLDTGVREGGPR